MNQVTASPLDDRKVLGSLGSGAVPSPGFRVGLEDVDVSAYIEQAAGLREHLLEPIRTTLNEAKRRYADTPALSDAWLGPRLHAGLRLSRREAAARGPWRFLGLWGADYVRWRFGRPEAFDNWKEAAPTERFVGSDVKQAFSRLWWTAELFRNGKNYQTAALALTNQDIINSMLRQRLAQHRPTALGALQVLSRSDDGMRILQGREVTALSKAANAAASTLVLDDIVLDPQLDLSAREAWEAERHEHDAAAYFDQLPDGPDDGEVPPEHVDAMRGVLAELFAEAPVRGRAQPVPEAS